MHLGITMFPTDVAIGPVELAREVEQRGFESLFLPEHTHIPVSRRTPYPGGGELPEEYKRSHDPFVALAAAATATSTLRLATGICLVAQRDPIVLAKQVASLDVISGGRLVLGVGFGWNADELEDHGVAYGSRRDVVRERMLAMQALWRDEVASFEGAHVKIPPTWLWPKPLQQPRPQVVMGGAAGERMFRDVAEYADGWMPLGGAGVKDAWPRLRAAAERAGRDPGSIKVSITGALPEPRRLARYAEMGVERVVLSVPAAPRDEVLPLLDSHAALIAAVG